MYIYKKRSLWKWIIHGNIFLFYVFINLSWYSVFFALFFFFFLITCKNIRLPDSAVYHDNQDKSWSSFDNNSVENREFQIVTNTPLVLYVWGVSSAHRVQWKYEYCRWQLPPNIHHLWLAGSYFMLTAWFRGFTFLSLSRCPSFSPLALAVPVTETQQDYRIHRSASARLSEIFNQAHYVPNTIIINYNK